MRNQHYLLEAWRPDHDPHLDVLVGAYLTSGNRSVAAGWVPEPGESGSLWLAGGLGRNLMRLVVLDDTGRVVGHIGVGTLPDPWEQIDLVGGKPGDYGELRRWLVHPSAMGSVVGSLLHDAAVQWTRDIGLLPVAGTFMGGSGASALACRGWLHRGFYNFTPLHVGVDVWALP